jgi:hypothetical protein
MSDSSGARTAWVERVLGVRLAASTRAAGAKGAAHDVAQSADVLDLRGRLQSTGNALRGLRDVAAPEAADLAARYARVVGEAKTDPVAAVVALDALEGDVARAASAARAREAPSTKGRGVAYRKLLLCWRDAQGTFDANLASLGALLLARPEIKADPRIEQIKAAVAALPKLVPKFGGDLENVLNDGMNAVEPAELERLAAAGITAIDAYREKLAMASQLLELEQFAAKDLGAGLQFHGALDQALVELKQQLAA